MATTTAEAMYQEVEATTRNAPIGDSLLAAHASAIENANLTAAEEGFRRGGDEWFDNYLSSLGALADDNGISLPPVPSRA